MGGVTPHGEGEGADRHIKCGIDVQEGKGLWARDVEEGMGSGFTRRDGLRVRVVGEGVGSRLMHWFVILGMVGLFTGISMCVVFFVLHYHLGWKYRETVVPSTIFGIWVSVVRANCCRR